MSKPSYLQQVCRIHASQPLRLFSVVALGLIVASGCAHFKQEQYFEVLSEPDSITGEMHRNFYKVTLSGNGSLVNKYNLDAAYVNAVTVDTLNGESIRLPGATFTKSNEQAFDVIKGDYLDSLKNYAAARKTPAGAAGISGPDEQDARTVDIARQLYFAGLTDLDLMSMGMYQSSDAYTFRKLVFYAGATNFDIKNYNKQISSAIENATLLAESFKQERALKDAAKKKQRQAGINLFKEIVKLDPDKATSEDWQRIFGSLLDIYSPDVDGAGK